MPTFSVNDSLDWNVSARPLAFLGDDGAYHQVTEKKVMIREDNNQPLGIVSNNYEPVQNAALKSLILPLVEEGVLSIQNQGYLNNGSKVFIQLQVEQEYQVIGEEYKGYLTLLNSHNGSTSVAIGPSMYRVICGNTFSSAYKEIGAKFRHTEGVTQRVLTSTAVVEFVDNAMRTYAESVEKLANTNCTEAQFRKAVEAIYQKPVSEMRDSFVERLNGLFYGGAGNEGSSMYDAFNAITDYSSHHGRKTDSGNFFYANFGAGANAGRRAMEVLTEMAAV